MELYKIRLGLHMVFNDSLTVLGLTPCGREMFFIAGLPKSGSTWLYRMMGHVPGINYRPMRGPSGVNSSGLSVNLWDDIDDGTFKYHPFFGCSVYKTHTRYSEENWRILTKNGVKKVVVLVRDPRDVAVSLFHHHRVDATHEFHALLHAMEPDHGIESVILRLMPDYVAWLRGWAEFAAASEEALIVRYEELYDRPEDVMNSIFHFYGVTLAPDIVARICRRTSMGSDENLGTNLAGKGSRFSTARKGGYGGWKSAFNDRHKSMFGELPEAAEVIAKLGYQI